MSYTSQLTGQQIDSALLTAQNIRINAGIPVSLGNGLMRFFPLDDRLSDNSGGVPQSQAVLKAIRNQSSQFMKFKGNVETMTDLPATGSSGDVYFVTGNGHFYGWSGSAWVDLGDFNISAAVSNPSLLDNADFANPVNQRGQTYYNQGYTVDRWKTNGVGVAVDAGHLYLASDVPYGHFEQYLDAANKMAISGKTVTMSFNIEVFGTTNCYSEMYVGSNRIGAIWSMHSGINTASFAVPTIRESDDVRVVIVFESAAMSINLFSAKLELGPVSTIANDHAPKRVLTFLECLQYYWDSGANGIFLNSTDVYISFPVPMRTTPSITLSNGTLAGVNKNGCRVTASSPGWIRLQASADL